MYYLDVHTHSVSLDESVFSILNKYPNSSDFLNPFSIGIHPWFIQKATLENELLILEEKLKLKNCFALRECGLDKMIEVDFNLQAAVFKKQVVLSEKYQKPLIIHCVRAIQEIIQLKKELQPKQKWIFHGFNKNLQVAEDVLKNGFVLSFGAAIIKNKKLQEVISEIPLDVVLLETDDSKISIKEVYQKLSEIKKIEVEALLKKIHQNFNKIFIR